MPAAPIPVDEQDRLQLLERYRLGEVGSESPFDHLTRTASLVFSVPIALVSIVTSDEQVFKGVCGLNAASTPRDQAFCAFAINVERILIVEDTLLDERFSDNPLVTGEPNIRFYAGVPLRVSDGSALGTLCIIDRQPRTLTADQISILEAMAATAVDMIQLRLGSLIADDQFVRLQEQSEALRKSSLRQSAILESAMDGILSVDENGLITASNPAAARLFGLADDELVGRSVADFLISDTDPLVCLTSEHSRTVDGTPLHSECNGLRADGRPFVAEVAISSFTLEGMHYVVLAVRDITERKKIEQMKSEFVATVSHELRTPLTAISGSLGLVAGGAAGDVSPKVKRLTEIALNNSTRLVRLINDILDMEKIEAGQSTFNPVPITLSSIVEQAVREIEGFAKKFEVSINLAKIDPNAIVMADGDRLSQVVTNLLSNAAKFSPPGGTIDISAERRLRGWRLNIADRGAGIPNEFKPKVFEKFAQADGSNTRKSVGTGLGLSIAREIMLRMGGTIGFADRPGGGTVFSIDIPGVHPDSFEPCALICQEEPDAASRACLQFERAGFEAELALSLDEVRALTAERRYSVLLLDLSTEGGEVAKLIGELRQRDDYSFTPIILTAFKSTDSTGSAPLAIANWFHKPLSPEAVRNGLQSIVAPKRSQKARILHVEDDDDVLRLVSIALEGRAELHCVGSIEDARAELRAHDFDLAILDLGLPGGSGTELLPDMWRSDGKPVPVVIFSAREDDSGISRRVHAVLTKSRASLTDLIKTVESVLTLQDLAGGEVAE